MSLDYLPFHPGTGRRVEQNDEMEPIDVNPLTRPPRKPVPDAAAPTNWPFPADFTFGVVTAATAIDGRDALIGPSRDHPGDRSSVSIWDVFAAAPGRISDGTNPADGPNHRENWRTDVGLLTSLGITGYRLSLPWSELSGPTTSSPTAAAWDFYRRLIDQLAERRIHTVVTLTHYDMPLVVMEQGGWLVRDTSAIFADWANTAYARLGDSAHAWVTLNAPLVHAAYGYGLGIEAPGLTLLGGCLVAAQHQLLGHGLAVQALRAGGARLVGIANAHTTVEPASADAADVAAAALYDTVHNRAFADPVFGKPWPAELSELPGAPADGLTAADWTAIAAPLDFYGVNYYHPQTVTAAPDNGSIPFNLVDPQPGSPTDEFGWPISAAGLTSTLVELRDRYPNLPPLWITENGTQDSGGLDDVRRVRFLHEHLAAAGQAIAEGVDVRAYFHWSLLDGWEFAEGLSRRFGLVAADPVTGQRHPKASYHAYRELLEQRRLPQL